MSQRETAQLPLVWRVFKIIGDVIWDMRAPLLVSIGAFIVFYVPGQTSEIYRALALEVETAPYKPILSLVLLAALSYFLWSMSRALWRNSVDIDPHVTFSPLARGISHIFSMLIALLPIIGVLMAMMPAGVSATASLIAEVGFPTLEDRETVGGQFAVVSQDIVRNLQGQAEFPPYITDIVNNYNQVAVYLLVGIQATAALLLVMFLFLTWRAFRPGSHFGEKPFSLWYFIPIVAALGAIVALVAAQPVIRTLGDGPLLVTWIITGVGSFSIICIFLMGLSYLLAGCTRVYDVIGIPAVTILVSAALIFAFFNWNNNHKIRLQPSSPEAQAQPDDLYIAFLDWLDARPDERKRLYANSGAQKYPVYVVAAQGGGVYAANLAALTMARLYTACPALRHHVFAVSGVSGGSLGASVFNAFWLQARRNQNREVMGEHCQLQAKTDGRVSGLEQGIRTYLGHDFLSPVLAGALFPDFLQRFIVPGFEVLDRARAFEASLNHAWIDTNRKLGNDAPEDEATPFERGFLSASADFRDPDVQAPSLVLNTTSVETGERFVVAPFLKDPVVPMEFVYPIMAQGEDGLPAEHDISLATAVSLSARFPIILPPGAYPRQISPFHFSQKNLVDGGYFESSAIETAIDLVNGIKQRIDRLSGTLDVQPEFRIIILNEDFTADLEPAGLTEFGAPVMTLDKTRRRRGQLAKWRVKTGEAFERFYSVELQHDYFYMPLGWHLSQTTQNMISEQIGFPSECKIPAYTPDTETAAIFGRSPSFRNFIQLINKLNNNRCSLADIITELPPARAQAAVVE